MLWDARELVQERVEVQSNCNIILMAVNDAYLVAPGGSVVTFNYIPVTMTSFLGLLRYFFGISDGFLDHF